MKKNALIGSLLLTPFFVHAQGIKGLITDIGEIINTILPLLIALAVLGFFFGLVKYLFKSGDIEAQKEARTIMIWGVVVIFVMVSVWGIVRVLQASFGTSLVGAENPLDVPSSYKPDHNVNFNQAPF